MPEEEHLAADVVVGEAIVLDPVQGEPVFVPIAESGCLTRGATNVSP